MNPYGNSTSTFNINDFFNWHKTVKNNINNPNGPGHTVVELDSIKPGEIIIMRQFAPNTRPIEVGRMNTIAGQNRLSLDKDFKGIVVGKPKDGVKKFEIVYVGFSEEEKKTLTEMESKVNKV